MIYSTFNILFLVFTFSCISCSFSSFKSSNYIKEKGFSLKVLNNAKNYTSSDSLHLFFEQKGIGEKKLKLVLNGKECKDLITTTKFSVPLSQGKLGTNTLWVRNPLSEPNTNQKKIKIDVFPEVVPIAASYKIINKYNHARPNFTQGLYLSGDTLFESSGRYGASVIKKYNYKTGEAFKSAELAKEYFAEGLTVFNDKVYLLTYKENKVFIYDKEELSLLETKTFSSPGWGITHDGHNLFISNGTSNIYKMKVQPFEIIDTIEVFDNKGPVKNINEMEYIEGLIFANIWHSDKIIGINPESGVVEKEIGLKDLNPERPTNLSFENVLNGIAYEPKQKKIIVTGKNWEYLYEIVLK